MTSVQPLFDMLSDVLWVGLAVFIRVGAAMAVLPGLGEQVISVRVKLVIGLVLTVIVAPAVQPNLDMPHAAFAPFMHILMTESISGLFIGIVLRTFIISIQTAGAIAAQSTSLSQILGQSGMDPLPAIAHILTTAALALLMTTGFHVKAAEFLIFSYQLLPAFQFPNPSEIADAGRGRVSQSFSLAFSLAAPFVIVSVIYNLTLGVINKAMPQLMVAFVGAPVITFGAIAMLLVASPVMLTVWIQSLEAFLVAPFR